MNRKLQRSTLALSATTAVFAMLLLAGSPAPPMPVSAGALVIASIDGDAAATASNDTGDVIVLRKHLRRSRAALALPYFSFAQGLRRITGS